MTQAYLFSGKHCILYELVDESSVEVLHISNPLSQPDLDLFRYPKAGEVLSENASVCSSRHKHSISLYRYVLTSFRSRIC